MAGHVRPDRRAGQTAGSQGLSLVGRGLSDFGHFGPGRVEVVAVPAITLRQVRDALRLASSLHDDFVKQTTMTLNKIAERDGPEVVADGLNQMADSIKKNEEAA